MFFAWRWIATEQRGPSNFCARKTSFVTDISVDLDEEPNSGSEMRRFKECHAKIPATDNSDVPAGLLWD